MLSDEEIIARMNKLWQQANKPFKMEPWYAEYCAEAYKELAKDDHEGI